MIAAMTMSEVIEAIIDSTGVRRLAKQNGRGEDAIEFKTINSEILEMQARKKVLEQADGLRVVSGDAMYYSELKVGVVATLA